MLTTWLRNKPKGKRIWPGKWYDKAAEMLRVDLETAEIPYFDDSGRVFDFHAIRHFYITELAKSGRTQRSSNRSLDTPPSH